jgi:UDP-N-acetylglucosamine 2-epimerase (non-hydrolysing)
MAPIVRELGNHPGTKRILIHTGQHYSASMDRQIMADVELPSPDYKITRPRNCVTHAQQTAYMLIAIERALLTERPDILLVCGDANTNLAGALAARKIHVQVGHVEAGLRSNDWRMPEEHNRVIIDHISDYNFAPTAEAKSNLESDGVKGRCFVVGNTIVDATIWATQGDRAKPKSRTANSVRRKLNEPGYALVTLHREENVDSAPILRGLLQALAQASDNSDLSFVFPVHPRTRKRIGEMGLDPMVARIKRLVITKPLGYLDFLSLLKTARVVLTDSGGIQEEACILQTPCITLRDSTERWETVRVGANRVVGTDQKRVCSEFAAVAASLDGKRVWPNPYGDGCASRRIVETCIHGQPTDEFGVAG